MKDIRTVGIVGLGALGTLYADTFTRALGKERVEVLANAERAARYRTEGVWFNGQLCDFRYADAARETEAPDLLLFAVKFGALEDAIAECRHLVGPDTVLISILNGISSEQILSDAFGAEKVVWCVAQKMAAKKEGNRAVCDPKGELAIGVPAGADPKSLRRLTAFFDSIGFPYSLPADIRTHMWSKLLCNTGCNQATLAFQCGYGGVQVPGPARDTMLAAMREVAAVAQAEGVPLGEKDVQSWLAILDSFPPEGETSMRQDGKARRRSEVELFAGTIRRLAARRGIPVPANDWLYETIRKMEEAY
jgi:2-dehydropantoate 2-reductase